LSILHFPPRRSPEHPEGYPVQDAFIDRFPDEVGIDLFYLNLIRMSFAIDLVCRMCRNTDKNFLFDTAGPA